MERFLSKFPEIIGSVTLFAERLFNAEFRNYFQDSTLLSQPDVDPHPVISIFEEWYSNLQTVISRLTEKRLKRHIVGPRQVIGWFLSEKFGQLNAISTYPLFKSQELSFLNKLFSPRDTMAHFLMLRASSYLSTYFSEGFLICFVTFWIDLGIALKRIHLTLTYDLFFVFSNLSSKLFIILPVTDENLWKMWYFSRKQLN